MKRNIYRLGLFTTIVIIAHFNFAKSGQASESQLTANNGYTYLRDLPLSQLLKLQKSVCDLSQCSSRNTTLLSLEKRNEIAGTVNHESYETITALPLTERFSR